LRTAEEESIEGFYAALRNLDELDLLEFRDVIGSVLFPTIREKQITVTYHRAAINVEMMLSIKDTKQFQSLGMLARAIFELAVELKLMSDDKNAVPKIALFIKVEQLKDARRFVAFRKDHPESRNIKPKEVKPYTANEVAKIVAACENFGRQAYERSRAKAMVLLLRYTALRIGDIAVMTKDRVSWDGARWRIFLRTEKNGSPVFLPLPDSVVKSLDAMPVPRGAGNDHKYFF
jgi:integrase